MTPKQEAPRGAESALDPSALEAAEERDAAASLERLEAGGIPVQAERRLGALARGERATFTSDLSVSGWALCHQLGLRPLTQVMGSSVYQVGYAFQTSGPGSFLAGAAIQTGGELDVLTRAWNTARELALGRLMLEATHAGADAVVGVKVQRGAHEWAEGAIEYVITGTAVADPGASHAPGKPVLTDLSVADYAKLRSAGIEPLGLVAWTSVHVAWYPTIGIGLEPERFQNYERREFTQAVYGAREETMRRLQEQAQGLRASGIVGMRVQHSVRELGEREEGFGGRKWRGAMLTFDAIGTAVHDAGTGAGPPAKTTLNLST